MRTKHFILICLIGLLLSGLSVSAQSDDEPYLYYYSRMLGGIIVEHPDGSDSRLIGADVIPPGLTGIGGPGWSPSGKYFAAFGIHYGGYNVTQKNAYLIDRQGTSIAAWLGQLPTYVWVGGLDWSPAGEKSLLLVGIHTITSVTFWLIDPAAGEILAEYTGSYTPEFRRSYYLLWELSQNQLRFYTVCTCNLTPTIASYYQITMRLDGTVIQQPATQQEFVEHSPSPQPTLADNPNYIWGGYGTSPSGDYEASGKFPTILRSHVTGEETELPTHSQGTVCRVYRWSGREDYILTLDGTLVAGGGCAPAVLGVTDQYGELWRELGGCSWDDICVSWLPPQVDISTLPPGQPQPVQLDPIAYELDDYVDGVWVLRAEQPDIRLRSVDGVFNLIDTTTQNILFQLESNGDYPYSSQDSIAEAGEQITMAYDPQHELIALYRDYQGYVSIWSMQTNPGTPLLRLNTYGYQLEFTPDGEQLRARNVNAWKIYNVSDILAAAGMSD